MINPDSISEDELVADPTKARPTVRLLVLAGLFAVAGFGLMFAYSDAKKLMEVASAASLPRLALPIAATLVSYVLMAMSYEGIAAAAGTPVGLWRMLRITFISNTFNYILATGGLSGFALRMYFFRRSNIPVSRAVTISLVQGLLTNFVLLFFLAAGFYFLLSNHAVGPAALASAGLMLAIFVSATLICIALLFQRKLRRRILFFLFEYAHRLSRRFAPAEKVPQRVSLWRLQHNIHRGLDFILSSWSAMLLPTVWIALDWFVTLGVLWGSFWCVNEVVPMAIIIVGFSIGILLSLVSIAPAGIGIMEGSMTTIFVALGIPLESSVIAVLIFRFAYYAVPFLISVALLRSTSKELVSATVRK
jgi:glycosyltransferase 2 family protein